MDPEEENEGEYEGEDSKESLLEDPYWTGKINAKLAVLLSKCKGDYESGETFGFEDRDYVFVNDETGEVMTLIREQRPARKVFYQMKINEETGESSELMGGVDTADRFENLINDLRGWRESEDPRFIEHYTKDFRKWREGADERRMKMATAISKLSSLVPGNSHQKSAAAEAMAFCVIM